MLDRRSVLVAGAALAGATVVPRHSHAAPDADLWPRWQAHDPTSTHHIDHGAWTELLARRVQRGDDDIHYVDYAGWWSSSEDREALRLYLNALQRVEVDGLSRDEQFAYWVNLYNAATLRVILDHYPVDSIRDIDISPGLFANGPWGADIARVQGEALTLDDIEHRILRPIWQDPRIHYAVNCAAIGCPNLAAEAFVPERLETMLDANARAYINHPRGIAKVGREVIASSIYRWFQEDFGGSEAGVLTHMRQYAEGETADLLSEIQDIDSYRYDWTLNGARAAG